MTKLSNKPKRKQYSDEFKAYLVQEAQISGRTIASIARDNGIDPNLLHNWKQRHKKAQTTALPATLPPQQEQPQFIPITLEPTEQTPTNTAHTPSLTTSALISDIQLQISSRNAPIHLHISRIATQGLIDLLRGLQ